MKHKKIELISFLDDFKPNDYRSMPKWYQAFAQMIEQRETSVLESNGVRKINKNDRPFELIITKEQDCSD